MIRTAAPAISSTDTAILNGIVAGFGEVLDISKVDKFTSEVKKIFEKIKSDSEGFSDEILYQMAFHIARNRAIFISQKKGKDVAKEAPKEEAPAEKFVQPIVKRRKPGVEPTATEQPVAPKPDEPATKTVEPAPTEEIPYEPPPESQALTIRRAISDGLDFVEGISQATTPEHLHYEAQKLFRWYVDKFDEAANPQDVYETVFRAAKNKAEEIVAANQVLVDKEDRRDMRARKREEAEIAERERQRIAGVARIELGEMVAKMLKEQPLSHVTKEALRYFKLVYLDGKRDPEVAHLFPKTTRDQRYKWKERAVSLIAPHASEDARKYISEKTKRSFASAEVLLEAAQMFLMRCEDKYE